MNLVRMLLDAGQKVLTAQADADEAKKVGTLRGGSVGILTDQGFAGTCPRKALLRSMGIQSAIDEDRHLMFAAGHSNEDSFFDVLNAAKQHPLFAGLDIKQEEECPIKYKLASGREITGRPDFILELNGEKVGIELKLASAVNTAVSALAKREPKLVHTIQAAHYALKTGIPWRLVYVSRADFAVPSFADTQQACIEAAEKRGVQEIVLAWRASPARKDGTRGKATRLATKIKPFYSVFFLEWRGNDLWVRHETDTEWHKTIITASGIEAYYDAVDTADKTGVLPPCPVNLTVYGEKEHWNACDPKYCAFSALCDRYAEDQDTNAFFQAAAQIKIT